MKIYKAIDKNFEKRGLFEKILTWSMVSFLSSAFFYKLAKKIVKHSNTATHVKKHATTHIALEHVYSFNNKLTIERGIINGLISYALQKYSGNAKALRNRLKLVKEVLIAQIDKIDSENIIILNLGAGSARSVLESAAEKNNKKFHIILLDKEQAALDASKDIVKKISIKGKIDYVKENINNIKNIFTNLKPSIVEMVGVLDYYDEKKSIKVLNDVHDLLGSRGVFITGNILPNKEEAFLTNLIKWPLVYKSMDELKNIIKKSKFSYTNSEILYEPMKIHSVLILRK